MAVELLEHAVVVAVSSAKHVVPHVAAAVSAPPLEVRPELPPRGDVAHVRHASVGVDVSPWDVAVVVDRAVFHTADEPVVSIIDAAVVIHAALVFVVASVNVPFSHGFPFHPAPLGDSN